MWFCFVNLSNDIVIAWQAIKARVAHGNRGIPAVFSILGLIRSIGGSNFARVVLRVGSELPA